MKALNKPNPDKIEASIWNAAINMYLSGCMYANQNYAKAMYAN